MCGTAILSQVQGPQMNSLAGLPASVSTPCTSCPGRGPQDREVLCPTFVEYFSGIYCSLLPLGCWSADSQRVVFDSAQRSRQVRGPDCVERQPL